MVPAAVFFLNSKQGHLILGMPSHMYMLCVQRLGVKFSWCNSSTFSNVADVWCSHILGFIFEVSILVAAVCIQDMLHSMVHQDLVRS